MADRGQAISELINFMDTSIDDFTNALPVIEQQIYSDIIIALKSLDLDLEGNIKQTVGNLSAIQIIRSKMQRIMQGDTYTKTVKDFSNKLNDVTKLSDDYLKTMDLNPVTTKFGDSLKKTAIDATRTDLGLISKRTQNPEFTQRIVSRTMDMVQSSVESGVKYSALTEQVREFIIQDKEGVGALQRYAQVIATDSINQYAGNYQKLQADNLGLEWFQYDGSIIRDSRAWCVAMVEKEYAHKSELSALPTDTFPRDEVPLYKKTGLPHGMIEGTNGDNIIQRRGGWNCNHVFMAVAKEFVPEEIRINFE